MEKKLVGIEKAKQNSLFPQGLDGRKTQRGRKPRHTRTEIAKVAIHIAGNEGIQAVSMRRVASELNSGTASLYRYVAKKDELLDLMVDCVREEESFPKLSGNWRANLLKVAHSTRALALRHPWMTKVSPVRTSLGLNSLRWWEFRLQILDGLGLTIDEMIVLINTLDNFVKGYAAAETAELEQSRSSGVEFERWLDNRAQYVLAIVSSGEFPLFNRIVRDAKAPHDPERANHEFASGLEHILNGFAAHISKKPNRSKLKRIAAKEHRSQAAVHKKEPRKS